MDQQAYVRYLNTLKLCNYRNYTVTSQTLDINKFNQTFVKNGHVEIACTLDDTKIHINLVANSKQKNSVIKADELRNILKQYKDQFENKSENNHIIIISKEKPRDSTLESKDIFKHTGFATIEFIPYKIIDIVSPEYNSVPKHTILNDKEANQLMIDLVGSDDLSSLDAISISDPQCIWLGAKKGQIIKIESVSIVAGSVINYRVVN